MLPRQHQREALHERHALDVERRQPQRPHEGEIDVAQHLERHVQPLDHFLLVRGRLRAQAEHLRAERLQVLVMIAEAAGLGRAAARARNRVPARQEGLARHSRARIAVHDDARSAHRRQVDPAVASRPQLDLRHGHAGKMRAGPVVDGNGEVRGQWLRRVEHLSPQPYACHRVKERPPRRDRLHSSPSRLSRSGRPARSRRASVKRRPVPPCR